MNPYSTHSPWSAATLAAFEDMPKDIQGRNLGFTEGNRAAWREWMKRTPKELWHPIAIQFYAELDRKKGQQAGRPASGGKPHI